MSPMFIAGAFLGGAAGVIILIAAELLFWRPMGQRSQPEYRELRQRHSNGWIKLMLLIFIALVIIMLIWGPLP